MRKPWVRALALDDRVGWQAWSAKLLGDASEAPPAQWWIQAGQLAQSLGLSTGCGAPIVFVPTRLGVRLSAAHYETQIYESGQVPVRTEGADGWHDALNALQWLMFPRSKALLNALQWQAIQAQGDTSKRSAMRDAITLLDEGAVLWIGAPELYGAVAKRQWSKAFVHEREGLVEDAWLMPFGHGLMQRLRQPYKALTAWAVSLPPLPVVSVAQADHGLAYWLQESDLLTKPWCALPVLAWPGWSAENEHPAFYEDANVFRPAGQNAQSN
jgi:hypothetical protein